MKKITSLLSLALVCSAGLAQLNPVTAYPMGEVNAPTVVYETQTNNLAPCNFETPSNGFENGYGSAHNPDLIWADDFVVNIDETFTVNQVSFNVYTEPGVEVDEADIFFYDDSGIGPGSQIASFTQVEVVSQAIIGASASGRDVRTVVFDITPTDFVGSSSAETVYWVGSVLAYGGTATFFEISTVVASPNEAYVYDAGTDAWYPTSLAFSDPMPPVDLVRTVSGECNVLSVNNNVLAQVGVYPNPTTGILNIQTPSNVTVDSVAVFDILGKKVNADYSNNAIDMTSLSQGIYLLKVETSAGVLTQKIVKQ